MLYGTLRISNQHAGAESRRGSVTETGQGMCDADVSYDLFIGLNAGKGETRESLYLEKPWFSADVLLHATCHIHKLLVFFFVWLV